MATIPEHHRVASGDLVPSAQLISSPLSYSVSVFAVEMLTNEVALPACYGEFKLS